MDALTWNKIISHFPGAHILQSWQWGEVKTQTGWESIYKYWGNQDSPDAAALILKRSLMFGRIRSGLSVLYVPKGPLLRDWSDLQLVKNVIGDLKDFAREQRAIFIKIDPDMEIGRGIPDMDNAIENPIGTRVIDALVTDGWLFSREQVQFRNTVRVNLSKSPDQLMADMKPKTRYNIRLAGRKGVGVRIGKVEDLDMLYRLYLETSLRDGFIIRDEGYYKNLWSSFMAPDSPVRGFSSTPKCEPFIAEVDGLPVAAVVIFSFAGTAYYMHGMSKRAHREKMPNHLLQWEAMIHAKEMGCGLYDFWGAPETFDENDPLWGVFRFKQGFNGDVIRTMGAYDYPANIQAYYIYTILFPKVLEVMRFFGRRKRMMEPQIF